MEREGGGILSFFHGDFAWRKPVGEEERKGKKIPPSLLLFAAGRGRKPGEGAVGIKKIQRKE